ncbi:MAG: divergent polysaccharide deacetylase family protein [Thermoanaerobaculia bacterium]
MTAARKRGGCGRALALLAGLAFVFALAFLWLRYTRPPAAPPPTAPTPVPTIAAPTPVPTPTAAPRPTTVPPDFEPAAGTGRGAIAVVIDDVGNADGSLARLERLSGPLAIAILPGAPHAREAAALAKRKGWDLLVHLPMAGSRGPFEPGTISSDDDDATIVRRVEDAIAAVPGAIGLNNHQGSVATADRRVVRSVLSVVRAKGLFFLDSRTSAASVATEEARALGLATIPRDVFLDDARAEAAAIGGAPEALETAFARALSTAATKGHAVVIGHPHAATVDFLALRFPSLAKSGVLRVRVSELVD